MPTHYGGGSIWDRVNEGVDRLFGLPNQGLLSEPDRRFARQQGLLSAGASLLRASGPTREPVGIGPALGEAVLAGREGSYGGLQATDALRERQRGEVLVGKRAELERKYAGKTDLPSLLSLFSEQMTMGDTEGARGTANVVQALAYNQPQNQAATIQAAAAYLQRYPQQIDPNLPPAEQVRQGRALDQDALLRGRQGVPSPSEQRAATREERAMAEEVAGRQARLLAAPTESRPQGHDVATIFAVLRANPAYKVLTPEDLQGIAQGAIENRTRFERAGSSDLQGILDRLNPTAGATPPVRAAPPPTEQIPVTRGEYDTLARQHGVDYARKYYIVK